MAKREARTTDTHSTKHVGKHNSDEARDNTAEAGDAGGPSGSNQANGPDSVTGPQTVDPELVGARGEFDGAIAKDEKDVQTESQANAALSTTGERKGRGEPQEFIETGAGRVQSTKPVTEPQ